MYAGGSLLKATEGIIRLAPDDWVNVNNSFGYVPLGGTKFYQERELNNDAAFFKLVIDHGVRPLENKGARYAYAVLPGAGVEETIEFYESPLVEILAQEDGIHAVRDNETGVVGINAFNAGERLCGITFVTPCSMIIDGNTFYVTDPTQTMEAVTVLFDADIEAVGDGNVTQEGRAVTVKMPIKGKSYSFTATGY